MIARPHREWPVEVHASLDAIDAARWDEAAADGGFYSSHGWLRQFAAPGRMFEKLSASYVTLSDSEGLLAAAASYGVPAPGMLSPSIDPFREYFGKGAPIAEESLYPLTICEAPLGFSSRLLVRPGVDGPDRAAAARRVVGAVAASARDRDSRLVAFGHLPAADARLVREELPQSIAVFALAEASISAEGGFEGHLRRLNHHRRDRVKAEVRHFADEGFTFRLARLSEVIPEFVPLFIAHEKKYGDEYEPEFLTGLFGRMAAGLDDRSRVVCAVRGGRIAAAAVFFVHGATWYARLWGVDPANEPKKAALYFNCMYHEPVRAAHATGARAIHYGIDSIDSKVSHGCSARSLWTVLAFASAPEPAVRAHLRAHSDARIASQAGALRKVGRDDAWIAAELELEEGRRLGG